VAPPQAATVPIRPGDAVAYGLPQEAGHQKQNHNDHEAQEAEAFHGLGGLLWMAPRVFPDTLPFKGGWAAAALPG
jgi:hypothetical protein